MSPLVSAFVAHFGEMGSRWGINRTVGQIYALIYVSPEPLNADEIAEALEFSRSNVSMGLKELQSWRLVHLSHRAGDRREYFDAPGDAWEVFRTLAEERRRREIEPTLSMLRNALLASADEGEVVLRVDEHQGELLFIVEDHGPGFSAEMLRHWGEPFRSTRDPGSGMGLGLFFVRRLAASMHGSLEVENRREGGARVTLILPQHASQIP
jgi:DNA-binding transcriptional regulator GbsR (MarR family)